MLKSRKVVESYVAPQDIEIEDVKVKKGSWIIAVKIIDDTLWDAIKEGEFTGFSLGGYAMTEEVVDDEEGEKKIETNNAT